MNLVEEFSEAPLVEIYHVIGHQETAVNTTNGKVMDFLTPNRFLAQVLSKKGFQYFYEEFNGNHTWTYWQPDLRRALKMLF